MDLTSDPGAPAVGAVSARDGAPIAVLGALVARWESLSDGEALVALRVAAGVIAAATERVWARAGVRGVDTAALADQLGCPANSARVRAQDAARLVELPSVLAGVAAGLGRPQAQAVARELADLQDRDLACDAAALILDRVAAEHGLDAPATAYRQEARAFVDRKDPAAATVRRQTAHDLRHLELEPLGDDMCRLSAVIRADHGARIKKHCEQTGWAGKDPRDLGRHGYAQLAADAFAAQFLGAADVTAAGGHDLAADRPAAPTTARPVSDQACAPGHTISFERLQPAATHGEGPGWPFQHPAAAPGDGTDWPFQQPVTLRTVVFLTVSEKTATGESETPALLHGVGSVSADLARRHLIRPDTLVVRVPVDDQGRMDTSHPPGQDPHAPQVDLLNRLFLVARDDTCRVPACPIPGADCDADHIVRRADGGHTGPDYQWLLCPGQHHNPTKHADGTRTHGNGNHEVTMTLRPGKQISSRPPVICPEHRWGSRAGP